MAKIAFIGLGAMGWPMARNLLRRGFDVHGFDIAPKNMAELKLAGGTAAVSTAQACADADFVILMVVDAAQAQTVLFNDGALAAAAADAIVCLMATCPPKSVEAIAERVAATGRRFIDAPVSGGTAGAATATLTIMAAAPKAVFEAAEPVFEGLGDKIFHVGEKPGQGAVVKTVNQLLCGVHIAVAAEAFSLAAKVGVDAQVMLGILSGTSASSWMLKDRGPRMIQDDPEVSSAIDIFVKDLGIVLEAGRETKAALPLAALSHQLFLSVSGRGHGQADDSQVIRAYRALIGA